MFRFFVEQKSGNYFILNQAILNHIKVARINNKSFICVYKKQFYQCILHNNQALIKHKLNENHEFNGQIVLGISLIKFKRFEWIIQKAAELGATKLIPIISENVNVSLNNLPKKYARWNKISQNACEQAFRNIVMEITPVQQFAHVLQSDLLHKFIAHEQNKSLVKTTFGPNSIFLIGPEGGFSDEEIMMAQTEKFEVINLGPRILRSETAALFALARINDLPTTNQVK